MARKKHEEQQPLTGAPSETETSASSSPNGTAAAAVGRYGAPDATTAGLGSGSTGVVGTASNGASHGLHDVYGQEEEAEAGYGGLFGAFKSNGSRAATGVNGDAARAHSDPHAPSDEMSWSSCDHARMGLLPGMATNGEPHLSRVSSGCSLYGGCLGFELTFRGRSPKFIRFGVLLLITLLPFGAHFMKNCFSSLEIYFLEDEDLHFNETKYGAVMSAIMIPNLFMPFFGGLLLDSKGHKTGIILFLALELVGHIFFTLAMGFDNFWMAVAGEALHGLGSGTVAVAMRSIVSQFFLENELTFALGVTVSGACVSKTLAKASVAPIAETKWGYMGALWYVGLWQVLSLVAGLFYVRLAASARSRVGMETEHKVLRIQSLPEAMKRSTVAFWCVAVLHTVLIMAYHLFANYSGHFLFENYHISAVLAGYISALMPLVVVFFAPIAGLVLDRWGGQLYVLLAAIVLTIAGYVMLLQNRVGAVVCILLLAFCESFVPTILLSALPLTVHPSVYGAAFGMAEVLSAVASIVANIFFGYSKDKTSSYNDDITFLVGLCFFGLALTIFLLFWDARHGQPVLNRVKWGRAPANTKSVGIVDPPLCASANGDSSTTIA